MEIIQVTKENSDEVLAGLVDVLVDCVNRGEGISISFWPPLDRARAEKWWRDKLADAAEGRRIILAAREDGRVAGTVQVELMGVDNQPHRADLQKMLVHGDFRRRGLATALMTSIEAACRALGRTVLVLDTLRDSPAEKLYLQLGWQEVGEIPKYVRGPNGEYASTVFFYKHLAEE